jgi:hypothetical protein
LIVRSARVSQAFDAQASAVGVEVLNSDMVMMISG